MEVKAQPTMAQDRTPVEGKGRSGTRGLVEGQGPASVGQAAGSTGRWVMVQISSALMKIPGPLASTPAIAKAIGAGGRVEEEEMAVNAGEWTIERLVAGWPGSQVEGLSTSIQPARKAQRQRRAESSYINMIGRGALNKKMNWRLVLVHTDTD